MTRDSVPATFSVRRRSDGRRAIIGCAVVVLTSIVATTARAAPRPVQVENLRIGFGATSTFKVGTWTPAYVQLVGGPGGFEGLMEVVVADDDGTPTSYFTRVQVEAGASREFPAYVRPGAGDPEITIRLYDNDRNRVANIPQDAILSQPPISLGPHEAMLLTIGRAPGVEGIPRLPGFREGTSVTPTTTASGSGSSNGESIVIARLDPRTGRFPGRWYGYDAARTIVLDTAEPESIKALDGLSGQPLVEWVKRGGHLVVTVGENWQALRDSVLGPILPGLPNGLEQVASLEALDIFAGSAKPITPPGSPKVMVTKLEQVKDRRGRALIGVTSDLPLVVRGSYGFGRVTLIAIDVDSKLFSDWPDRSRFWARALDLHAGQSETANVGMPMGRGRFNRWAISDIGGLLRASLEQFPGVKLIPFGWVAFFIFLYILMIGPGDYFFLKKVLKRMELTWITFPTIVVTVSLLAYYAAYLFKGNDLLINQVDVVDIDQPAGLTRGQTWVGMFSPQNRDYSMRVLPMPLDRSSEPDAKSSAGEPARPPAGTEVLMSWFSSPEDQFGAMGNSSRRFSLGNGGYSYTGFNDRDGREFGSGAVEALRGVRIPIWSTKCVTSRWFGPTGPVVDADLRPNGTDRLIGTITNRLDIPLEDALVAFGKHVYLTGTIAPHATTRVELAPNDRDLSGYLRDERKGYLSAHPGDTEFKIQRAALMIDAMFHASETQISGERNLSNDAMKELDLTGQLALSRPMLVARIDRPAARLVLDDPPSPPKLDQTTLLRVILPLAEAR